MTTEDRAELVEMLDQTRELKRVFEAQRDRHAQRADLRGALDLVRELKRELQAHRAREGQSAAGAPAIEYQRVTFASLLSIWPAK